MGENEARDSNAHRASAATGTCDMNWSREQVAASPSRGRVCDRGIRYFCLAPSLQNQPKGTISIVRSLFLACCERHANAVSEGVANMPCRPGRLCQTRYGQLRQASVGVSGARNSIKHQKSLAQVTPDVYERHDDELPYKVVREWRRVLDARVVERQA